MWIFCWKIAARSQLLRLALTAAVPIIAHVMRTQHLVAHFTAAVGSDRKHLTIDRGNDQCDSAQLARQCYWPGVGLGLVRYVCLHVLSVFFFCLFVCLFVCFAQICATGFTPTPISWKARRSFGTASPPNCTYCLVRFISPFSFVVKSCDMHSAKCKCK